MGTNITEGLNPVAQEAFTKAAWYVDTLISGEKPAPITDFVPDKSPEFYTAMAIGVRHFARAAYYATGTE